MTHFRPSAKPRLLALAMLLSCAAAHAQQRYWYDGEQRRALWAEASVVADFSVRSAEKSQVLNRHRWTRTVPRRTRRCFATPRSARARRARCPAASSCAFIRRRPTASASS